MENDMIGTCPNCGEPVDQPARGRRRIYCSDACRYQYKNRHPNISNWKSAHWMVCPICGKNFLAGGVQQRKYCSRTCANRGRSAERRAE